MSELYLVIPEHTDAEGVTRSLVLYGDDEAADHFRAALIPPQPDPLAVMEQLLAPGWERFAEPHPGVDFNEVSEITFLGLDIVREGVRLSILRGFPLGATAAGRDLHGIVRQARATVRRLLLERGRGGGG